MLKVREALCFESPPGLLYISLYDLNCQRSYFFQYLITELKAEVSSCVSLLLLLAKQFASTKSPSDVCHFIWITATYQTRWMHIKKTTHNKDCYPHRPSAKTRAERTKRLGWNAGGWLWCVGLKSDKLPDKKWKIRSFTGLLMMLNTFYFSCSYLHTTGR